jgi:putative phosphoesterase
MQKKFTAKNNYQVGVISDTHGRLPQSVLKAFKDADLIIHAGDIGKQEILEYLRKIAPIIVVRGNMDTGNWAHHLPEKEVIKVCKFRLCVIHDVYKIELISKSSTCQIVISGHTHRPLVEKQQEVLFLNPGSAVQPRHGYPASVALLRINENSIDTRLIEITD